MIDLTVVLVREAVEVGTWRVRRRGCPDFSLVEELARMQVCARRMGCSLLLREVSADLADLIGFAGLDCLRVEVAGQAESGEEVGVEEVVVSDDPVA